jgi:hypothetical protein
MTGLPFEYAVRNLARRPLRMLLAALSAAAVAALLAAAVAFAGGLERSTTGNADARVALLLSSAAGRDLVRSSVPATVDGLVAAGVPGVAEVNGVPAVSAEIHSASDVRLPGDSRPRQAFLRGVTERAFLVHEAVGVVDGAPPQAGEVLVGRLVPGQLGLSDEALATGRTLLVEGQPLVISGHFAAPGTTLEAELWLPLTSLRALTRRDDSSAVFVRLRSPDDFAGLDLFARRRLDLELTAVTSQGYYADLAAYVRPLARLVWMLSALIALAALLSGANVLNAAVQDRVSELAMLRALGYGPGALARSLAAEGLVVAAAGGVLGLLVARLALPGHVMRLAMTAFPLELGPAAVLLAFGGVLLLGALGAGPAVARVLRLSVADGLREP